VSTPEPTQTPILYADRILTFSEILDACSTYQILYSIASASKGLHQWIFTEAFWKERHRSHPQPTKQDPIFDTCEIPLVYQRILKETPYLLVTHPISPSLTLTNARSSFYLRQEARIKKREFFIETIKALGILANKKFGSLDWTLTPFGRYFILHVVKIIRRNRDSSRVVGVMRWAFASFLRALPGNFSYCPFLKSQVSNGSAVYPPIEPSCPGFDIRLWMRLAPKKWSSIVDVRAMSIDNFNELCDEFLKLPVESDFTFKIGFLIMGVTEGSLIFDYETKLIGGLNEKGENTWTNSLVLRLLSILFNNKAGCFLSRIPFRLHHVATILRFICTKIPGLFFRPEHEPKKPIWKKMLLEFTETGGYRSSRLRIRFKPSDSYDYLGWKKISDWGISLEPRQ